MRRSLLVLASCAVVAAAAAVGPADAGRTSATPKYRVYTSPVGLGNQAGEPTLGVIPGSDTVLYQALTETLSVSGWDRKGAGNSTWRNVAPAITSQQTFDPILETDPQTGRTFVSQLTLACSLMAFTDDRGESWTDVPLGCGVGAMFDHQTVGVGSYVKGGQLERLKGSYPNVVYYCAQDVLSAKCSPSVDGGRTFLPANVVYSTAQCHLGGIFGHLKAAPDGTIYLPPRQCSDPLNPGSRRAAVAVSEDNGLTWTMRTVPDSKYGDAGHGSVAVASDGTVYLSWGGDGDGGGAVNVAVSRDKGKTWSKPYVLDRPFGIKNSRFPVAVAGDGDRAVVAWLGTPEKGNGSATDFKGVWHLYASHTYDRGKTWKSYRITSNPVQVGAVCTAGTTCTANRNLLDFNDMVIDSKGRVYIAFADGCIFDDCTKAHRAKKGAIARLVGGRGLHRKFDGKL